jgi:hypothetical protein
MDSGHPDRERDRYQRFWEQLREIEDRLQTRLAVEPRSAAAGTGVAPRYVYEAGQLLCADQRVEELVRQRLPGRCGGSEPAEPRLPRRLAVADDVHIPTEVDRLNRVVRDEQPERTGGPAVSPNHLASIALNPVTICPADEPKPVPRTAEVWPPPAGAGGDGVRVFILDTGLPPGHPWEGDERVSIHGGTRPASEGLIRQYAGHGAFVTGVLKSAAPGAEVTVSNALRDGGALLERSLGTAILELLADRGWPHIISLSAGGTSHRSQDLLGLAPFLAALAEHPRTVLVAAAGNDGNRDNLFFPAARAASHPGVISVGALRRDGRGRTCFSNYGDSVTVFAPGEHHVNTFLSGLYGYQHPREPACRYHRPALYPDCPCLGDPGFGTVVSFAGMARWSGTSYATPLVAGMIASHMTALGEPDDARSAARDLLARRRETIADVDGEILPVLRLR